MLTPALRSALVAAMCNHTGYRLDDADVIALVALLDDLEDLSLALDEAGVDTCDRAEGTAAKAYDYTGRAKALIRDRNNARDMRAQTLETLKTTIAERDAITAGPKGAAWASLRQTSSLVAVQAANLEAENARLKAENEKLRTTSTEIVTDGGRLAVVVRQTSGAPFDEDLGTIGDAVVVKPTPCGDSFCASSCTTCEWPRSPVIDTVGDVKKPCPRDGECFLGAGHSGDCEPLPF